MKHDELTTIADLVLFARVVEARSITRGAALLGYERTTVSRRISALEDRLGEQLLSRTTRTVTATAEGQRCYEQCVKLLRAASNAISGVSNGKLPAHCRTRTGRERE